jgi:hypothetical protein
MDLYKFAIQFEGSRLINSPVAIQILLQANPIQNFEEDITNFKNHNDGESSSHED